MTATTTRHAPTAKRVYRKNHGKVAWNLMGRAGKAGLSVAALLKKLKGKRKGLAKGKMREAAEKAAKGAMKGGMKGRKPRRPRTRAEHFRRLRKPARLL